MSEIAPPRNLTPGLCKAIEAEMLRACAEVAARHGLVSKGLGVQAMDLRWNFEFGVRVSIAEPLAGPSSDGIIGLGHQTGHRCQPRSAVASFVRVAADPASHIGDWESFCETLPWVDYGHACCCEIAHVAGDDGQVVRQRRRGNQRITL